MDYVGMGLYAERQKLWGYSTKCLLILELVQSIKAETSCQESIQMVTGDRQRIHLWYDWWHPLGPLLQVFLDRIIHLFRSLQMQKSILHYSKWRMGLAYW